VTSEGQIRRLVGVYNADGTMRGELSYLVGRRLGRAHCALCDITHGAVRERHDWKECRRELPVPFDTYHRDDQPDAVRRATRDRAPAVVAETDRDIEVLLGPEDLEACSGSPRRLLDAIALAAAQLRLDWPPRASDGLAMDPEARG
jgi:hypothetical protein